MTATHAAAGAAEAPSAGAFVTSRSFEAPRELVWKAFTEPERLRQWWGPKGFACRQAKVDLRPGGLFHYDQS